MNDSLHNLKEYKPIRKNLRNNSTSAEASLWNYLKGRKLLGKKFRRQASIGKYVVDFYCPEEKLAIELDGEVHQNDKNHENDTLRDIYLNQLGIAVLRFENRMVFEYLNTVLKEITKHFKN